MPQSVLAAVSTEQVKTGVAMLAALVLVLVIIFLGLVWFTIRRNRGRSPDPARRPAADAPDPWLEAGRRATPLGPPDQGPPEPGSES